MRTLDDVDLLCINTIRTVSIDAVQKADSGHPGLPLGAAPMAWVLWRNHLRVDPTDPKWADRDRFVLSAGHGSMLLYSLLHLGGFPLSMDDLKSFRQWESKTPGHPESFMTQGVDATTGPLGQGTANAVGMAIAERMLAHRFNRPGHTIVDHFTYAIAGDGDLMEGISGEAASLAGHLGLSKLVMLYDSNDVSLDGPTSLAFSREDVSKRYEAYGWRVLTVGRGDTDLASLDGALSTARRDDGRPTLIVVKTTIGYGSPKKAGTSEAHGSPLGADEVAATKKVLGFDPTKSFVVPDAAAKRFAEVARAGGEARAKWKSRFEAYRAAHPDLATAFEAAMAGTLPAAFDAKLPEFPAGEKVATRKAGGKALNHFAKAVPTLVGGDADLSVSTNTKIEGEASFDAKTGAGRNIHFGVREHAMGAIANGMAWHGGVRPFTATFFAFADYMRPAIRLAALNHLPVVFVFTHDSIALGEDGPTHQPVEQLMSLRVMPGLDVIRPCDANETMEAWRAALLRKDGPTVIVLSRQNLPTIDRTKFAPARGLESGGYVLADATGKPPRVILVATGSEVALAMSARDALEKDGVPTRVVSMPSFRRFFDQPAEYRESVLPRAVRARVGVEAGATLGWERVIGDAGRIVGIDRYGASAPGNVVLEKLGFTVDAVVRAAKDALAGAG